MPPRSRLNSNLLDRLAIALDGQVDRNVTDNHLRVFGVSLHHVSSYASTTAILGGHQHQLPIVVFACIEELYRTGLYQKGLFRDLPNRERHIALISKFDTDSTSFGRNLSLRSETTPDICALLLSYISSLPDPVLSPPLFDALWDWCVKPSVERDTRDENEGRRINAGKSEARTPQDHENVPRSHNGNNSPEQKQIAIAQILLLLLPSANFSLLFYLFSFFTQIPLSPENGIQFDDLARIFAFKLLGGPSKTIAGRVMVWTLRRWSQISAGLSPKQHSIPMHASEQSLHRNSQYPSPSKLPRRPSISPTAVESKPLPPIKEPSDGDHEVLLPTMRSRSQCSSQGSSAELEERLLDIESPDENDEFDDGPHLEDSKDASALVDAMKRIRELERELEKSDMAVSAAVRDAFNAREEATLLKLKITALESTTVAGTGTHRCSRGADAAGGLRKGGEPEEVVTLKKRLEEAQLERSKAWQLLEDVRTLVCSVDRLG